ncbi:hypothetical protein M422DRAFT_267545, partial [Sphaerobolus stellatus SS14]
MPRPIKYDNDNDRKQAILRNKRNWAHKNQDYVRKEALRRYHATKDSKSPRKYTKPKSRASSPQTLRIQHVRRPRLRITVDTNLDQAVYALWRRAVHQFSEYSGAAVLPPLYHHFVDTLKDHPGEHG